MNLASPETAVADMYAASMAAFTIDGKGMLHRFLALNHPAPGRLVFDLCGLLLAICPKFP